MSSLDSKQKQVIREFIDYGKENYGFPTHNALQIALVFSGKRDGCLVGCGENKYAEKLKEIFEDIPHQYKNGNVHQFYIGKSDRHVSKYNPAHSSDYKVGKFFGYPDPAIEFYVNNSNRVDQYHDFLESEESQLTPSEESDKLFLIEYVPEPTSEGIQRALKRQREYERTLNSLSVKLSDCNNWGIR